MKNRVSFGLVLLFTLIIFVGTFLLLNRFNIEKLLFATFSAGMLAGITATLLGLYCMQEVGRNAKPKAEKTPYTDINLMDTKFQKCG